MSEDQVIRELNLDYVTANPWILIPISALKVGGAGSPAAELAWRLFFFCCFVIGSGLLPCIAGGACFVVGGGCFFRRCCVSCLSFLEYGVVLVLLALFLFWVVVAAVELATCRLAVFKECIREGFLWALVDSLSKNVPFQPSLSKRFSFGLLCRCVLARSVAWPRL